jgi:predicted nucleic acid-binding protein
LTTLLDTSAFIAVMDMDDKHHTSAASAWNVLIDSKERLVLSGYAMVETFAVVHRKYGTSGVQVFLNMLPVIEISWPDDATRDAAITLMLCTPGKGGPSLVDCVNFKIAEQGRIQNVFAYDKHFAGRGFTMVG